ncbi:glycosyltransferase family 4 protein [Candidatus Bathyarchaeota archaeon]|nr:glycosyltransferase family 4 protein [Candidatus Bathyarchaeota archaeon]
MDSSKEKDLSILGIFLGLTLYPGFVSGGDLHFIELLKRCKTQKLAIVTSKTGARVLKDNSINAKTFVISVPFEDILCNMRTLSTITLFWIFVTRILKLFFLVFLLPRDFHIICASSHGLYDVLPAVIISRISPSSKLVVYAHLLEPPPFERAKYSPLLPNILTWVSQSLSILLIKRAHAVVFVYPSEEECAIRHGILRMKVKTMYNGINVEEINKVGKLRNEYDACFLARLAPYKGIFDIVRIWKIICQKLPNARIAVIGTEREKYVSRLRNVIKEAGLGNNITLLGALSGEKKYAVLKSCKIFFYPSYLESWGIVVYEAMACGLPVIVYDLPAYKILDGGAIIKVKIGNTEAFSKATLKLLTDEELRRKMGKRAKTIVSQFDWDKVIERELDILSALLRNM